MNVLLSVISAYLFMQYTCKLKYVKKRNCFVFIVHLVNKHGVSTWWFTEVDTKHFKSGALRAMTNITSSMIN